MLRLLHQYKALFQLSYVGGDGNDVVLSALNGKEPSSASVVSTANPSTPGQSVTFTATITGSGGTPTGNMTFKDGTTTLGTATLSGGSATYSTSTLATGSPSITVVYPGDSTFDGSMSTALIQTVDIVPGAPTIGTATAGNAQISVAFTAPGSNGGSAITSYTATCGSQSASGAASPIIVGGLTNGTSYSCTVTATNGVGTGPASAASNSVMPTGRTTPTAVSLTRAVLSPTMADAVTYTLTFGESVSGLSASNLSLVPTGSIAGATVGTIGGSGTTWTVAVNTGRGSGTLRLDVANGTGIVNGSSNTLGGTLPFNDEIYTVDKGGTVIGSGQGQPVAGFGTAGYALFNEFQGAPAPGAIAMLSGGRILAAGGRACDPANATARCSWLAIRPAAYPIQHFWHERPSGDGSDGCSRGTLCADRQCRRYDLGGRTMGSSGFDFLLLRLNASGTLDSSSFGTGGVVTTRFAVSSGDNLGRRLVVQPDDKIVLVGSLTVGHELAVWYCAVHQHRHARCDLRYWGTGGRAGDARLLRRQSATG